MTTISDAARALGQTPAHPSDGASVMWCGLTKREAFAMAALQGVTNTINSDVGPAALARIALNCADALLEALSEGVA